MRTALIFFLLSIVGLLSGIRGLQLADLNESPQLISLAEIQKLDKDKVDGRWVTIKAYPYWEKSLIAYTNSAMPEHFIKYVKESPEEKQARENKVPLFYLLPLTAKAEEYKKNEAIFVFCKNITLFKTAGNNSKAIEFQGILRNDINRMPPELDEVLEKMKLGKDFSTNTFFLEDGLRAPIQSSYYVRTALSGLVFLGSIIWMIFNFKRKRMPDEIEESSGRPF